jgi:hypothetical protein
VVDTYARRRASPRLPDSLQEVAPAAADLPLGTLVVSGSTVLEKTAKPALPWRIGASGSHRFLADWRADEAIETGASVVSPDEGGNA